MKDNTAEYRFTVLFGLLLLFFIQQLTTLIEAVYRYNLLDIELGPATSGLVAFTAPLYLFFKKQEKDSGIYVLLWLFILLHCFIPWLPNPLLIVVAAGGVSLFLIVFVYLLAGKFGSNSGQLASGMVLAVLLSVCLRAFGSTLDISQSGPSVVIGYLLIATAVLLLYRLYLENRVSNDQQDAVKSAAAQAGRYYHMTGIFSIIGFICCLLASPGILTRWTGSGYLINNLVLSLSLTVLLFLLSTPGLPAKIKKWQLILWNLLFGLLLMFVICLQLIDPPPTSTAGTLIIQSPPWWQAMLTYAMLLLSPVLFLNVLIFAERIRGISARLLAGPALSAALLLLLVIFLLIASNIWGYLGPFGPIFRQTFYLPFLILIAGIIIPIFMVQIPLISDTQTAAARVGLLFGGVLLCGLSLTGILTTAAHPVENLHAEEPIVCMTFNLQLGTDCYGNRSYAAQLNVIRNVNPDILCLQESDAARISAGNNDIVRYLADRLDYYSYYGPLTVTGTFGTAILSRFPLEDCRSIFTYSDKDEIGTAVCTVRINDKPVLIVNSHPDGSDTAKQAHLNMLINLARQNERMIALGDFNFEPDSPFYDQITATLKDTWLPADFQKVSERIDYIFLSGKFKVLKRTYIPSPASASDHPAYAVEIKMAEKKTAPTADQAAAE